MQHTSPPGHFPRDLYTDLRQPPFTSCFHRTSHGPQVRTSPHNILPRPPPMPVVTSFGSPPMPRLLCSYLNFFRPSQAATRPLLATLSLATSLGELLQVLRRLLSAPPLTIYETFQDLASGTAPLPRLRCFTLLHKAAGGGGIQARCSFMLPARPSAGFWAAGQQRPQRARLAVCQSGARCAIAKKSS